MTAAVIPITQQLKSAPQPLIIAHRGCSGERPEHTRAAYLRALDQGADVIEPDLVMSADGHLVIRHENNISETTDVAERPEFAGRKARRTIDGEMVEGWFTEDFTLTELKTLRARERLPHLRPVSAAFDGQEPILTFDEILVIAREATARTGRTIQVAPELKHPSYFAACGLDIESAFIEALKAHNLTGADAPVLVQCFEVGPLQRLSQQVQTPLLQLMSVKGGPVDRPDLTYAQMATPEGLEAISGYAGSIGVETGMIIPRDADGQSLEPTTLIPDAHAAGLRVVSWTFRAENVFLPVEYRKTNEAAEHGDLIGYIKRFYDLGLDAVFCDFPALAYAARLVRRID